MRPLTLSPETLAQGLLERDGASRGLLILCGFSRLRQARAVVLQAEEGQMAEEVKQLGGERGGPRIDELQDLSADKLAQIEDFLLDEPDDLVLCSSDRILAAAGNEVQTRLSETALPRPNLGAEVAVRILLSLCTVYFPEDASVTPMHVDPYLADVGGARAGLLDHLIEVGLRSRSIAVVSDDPAIALQQFAGHGHTIRALDLDYLVRGPLGGEDPAEVEGGLLERLLAVP